MIKLKTIFFKGVEIFMSEDHLKDLEEHLKEDTNVWLSASLKHVVQTDENGLIVMFKPRNILTMGLMHFFQNLMVGQRCYLMDEFMKEQGVIK